MAKKSKATKQAKPAMPPIDPRDFHPGLIELDVNYGAKKGEPVQIRQSSEDGKGRVVCTIVPGEALSADCVFKLAEFFSYAPEMWRLLRVDTANRFDDLGLLQSHEEIRDRLEVLSESTGMRPFDPPQPQCDDGIYRKRMGMKPEQRWQR